MTYIPIPEFEHRTPQTIELLKELVEHESPTYEKGYIDNLGRFIADRAQSLGAEVTHYPQQVAGDHWAFSWGSGESTVGREFLLLTHMDTVYDLGTLNELPWRVVGEKIFGPGVLDMKFGIATALTVIEAIQAQGSVSMPGVTLLCTSDEETGSDTSRGIIENLAQEHKLTLCLEPALPGGALKTWRKGIGAFTITTEGIPAHAGADPNPGVNAIQEMAYQLTEVVKMADSKIGTSLNLGRIKGGTRTNVVAETCSCIIDVRVKAESEREVVDKAFASLSPKLENANVSVSGEWNRPPMQRTPLMVETYQKAKALAGEIGIDLSEGGTGGGSDANFVAALGLPVLDGLGAIGEGAHSRTEHIQSSCIPERAAILAAIITGW